MDNTAALPPAPRPVVSPCFGRAVVMVLGVAAWGLALFGSLQIHRFTGLLSHDLCGPWGCAATPEALLGYHVFLLVLMAPSLALVCRWLPAAMRGKFAWSLLMVGTVGAAVLATHAGMAWQREATSATQRQYTLHRAAFVVATTPDLPVVQLALSGLACTGLGNLSRRTRGDRLPQSDAAAAESPAGP